MISIVRLLNKIYLKTFLT